MCHQEPWPGAVAGRRHREEVGVPVGSETMPAYLARPEAEPVGAVLVAHDIFGRSAFYEGLADALAAAGYEALVPDFFFRLWPLPERTHEEARRRRAGLDEVATLDDLAQALAWLRARPSYRGRLGTVGFCMGGTFVLDLSAREPDLVTVAYYGFPRPQATLVSPPPAPLDLVAELRGPILALWGEQDAAVGMDNVAEFERRCAEEGVDVDVRVYPGVGHGFLALDPADDPEGARHAQESWQAALGHLRAHLAMLS